MALQLVCDCGTKFLVDAKHAGKRVRCPDCGTSILVPLDRGGRTDAARPVMVEPEPEDRDEGMIEFRCQACNNTMKAQARFAGLTARCPKCQEMVQIPGGRGPLPRPGKGKTGRIALLGLLALLLIAGGIGLAVWLNRKPAGSTIQATDINDLSLVPANAQGLLCLKVATLWQQPAVQKAILDRRQANPGQTDLGQRLEKDTGLKLDDIERLTFVSMNASKKEGWAVVKTTKPYDQKALLSRMKESRQEKHLDRPYFVGQNAEGQPVAVACVSPRVLILGDEPGVKQALGLIGSPIEKGVLAPVIALCDKDPHAVMGYNPAAGEAPERPLGIDLAALSDVELIQGTMTVREQAELEVRARTVGKDKAERFHGTVNGWIGTLKGVLFFAQFQPGEKGKQATEWNKLLGAVKLGIEENDVVGTLKTDPAIAVGLLLGAGGSAD